METTTQSRMATRPWTFRIVKWYGYAFAATYLLFGGVKIILGILDHTTASFGIYFFSLVLGMILAMVVAAFRDGRPWGWYGMVGSNALVCVLALLNLQQAGSLVLLILSFVVLGLLFYPQTKAEIFKG